jgi:alkylation response protein AidB-like acyl-CoA dehydrogenase
MHFQLSDEHRMIKELVEKFVKDELLPLEARVMAREAAGGAYNLGPEDSSALDAKARALGLWGLDAPADVGGSDLSSEAMIGVYEALGRTITPYSFPPDTPNLRMLKLTASPEQQATYLAPYAKGELRSAIAISEPGAGADPAGMTTRAERDGEDWVLNGRKIWISGAATADFTIVMAVTDKAKGQRGGMSAFIVDRNTPGFNVQKRIPMIGGASTYEIVLEDCRLPANKLLGKEGHGFGAMQARLSSRRLQMGAWCCGIAQRALDMMVEYAPQRSTFGIPLSDRQTVQWWVADAATKIHATRLMTYDAAWKADQGQDVRQELSMIKVFATEMATEVVDHAMQCFGALGMTKEMPLQLMANRVRLMRIFEGPSEVHRWVVARKELGLR